MYKLVSLSIQNRKLNLYFQMNAATIVYYKFPLFIFPRQYCGIISMLHIRNTTQLFVFKIRYYPRLVQ